MTVILYRPGTVTTVQSTL